MYPFDNHLREIKKANGVATLWSMIFTVLVTVVAWLLNCEAGQQKMKSILVKSIVEKKLQPEQPAVIAAVIEEVPQSEPPSIEFNRETLSGVQELPSNAIVIDDLISALNDKKIKDYFTQVDTWVKEEEHLVRRSSAPFFPRVYFKSWKTREDFINHLPGIAVFIDRDTNEYNFADEEKDEYNWITQGYTCQIGDEIYYTLDVFPNRENISL